MRRPAKNHSALARLRRAKAGRLAPSLFSIIVLTIAAAIGLGLTLLSDKVSRANAALQQQQALPGQRGNDSQMSESAARQIQSLLDEKEQRTPAQQKIDSQLLYTIKMRRGETIAQGLPSLETDVAYDDDGRTVVDIRARVTNALLRRLRAQGAVILHSDARYESIRALIRLDRIERIAAFREVVFIQPKQEATTNSSKPQDRQSSQVQSDLPTSFRERADRVREFVADALASKRSRGDISPQAVGSQASQGDVTHRVTTARGTFGVNGSGIKIGVLSDGVTNLAASQALGDLGPVTVLPGQAGTGDEGTAMLEIIHDLVPGAQLFFATAFTNITSFAQNIRDLRTAGCDIIVDDVFYFVESAFQDGAPGPTNTNGGVVIQAVNDVVADGAMYFSSAGNSGNKNDNRSGVWEGDFLDGGASAAPLPLTGNVHNFGGQNFNVILANGSLINLHWSDPLGASSNDYDLFILNSTGTAVLASSTNIQNGTQDPYEQTGTGVNLRIVVLKKTGAATRFLHVNSNRGRLSINTDGQTHGHAGATGAFGCAATPANTPFGAPPNPVGPFPSPFNSTNTVELFSSDGPRRIFYQANGTPFTPGDFSSTGGMVLQKPDITAADGTSVTGVGGFPNPFFGTSAAAPHAAAIAALIKSSGPFTNAQIKNALLSTAIDIEAPGTDRDSGAGIIMAFEALNFLGVAGQTNLELGTVTAMENPGDANGNIEAGEGAKLTVQLKNSGVVDATVINSTLTTSTPGVTITQPNTSAYPDLPALGGMGNNITPFTFTLASNADCPLIIDFTLTVTYTGGTSPKMLTFQVTTGQPPIGITSTLDTTPPVSGAGFTATTGMQTGRVIRNGVPSTCGVNKTFPGLNDSTVRQFDAYTFTPCPSGTSHCITVTLTNSCTGNRQLFDVVYLNSFDPANIGTNYRADAGASNTVAGPISFSTTIPASTNFVVVVSDVNLGANSAVGCSYTLQISGVCVVCPVANQVPVAQCQNVTVPAGPGCMANASVNNGSFDPDGGMLTITQTPAGPYPVGMTSVLLTVTDDKGATSQCTATVTVTDSTPPSITCPASTFGVAAVSCPVGVNAIVTYTAPTSSDNCGAAPVVCTPPSGSAFPVGTTTVTCTATDGGGNTATCSFNVQVYNICLQDDSNPNVKLLIDTATGKYQFTCGGAIFTGTGTITRAGCVYTLDHTGGGVRVRANFNTTTKSGTASLQQPLGTTRCTITDRNMANNNCNGAP